MWESHDIAFDLLTFLALIPYTICTSLISKDGISVQISRNQSFCVNKILNKEKKTQLFILSYHVISYVCLKRGESQRGSTSKLSKDKKLIVCALSFHNSIYACLEGSHQMFFPFHSITYWFDCSSCLYILHTGFPFH